jgi:transcriptional regulator/AAA ATPase-like protein
MARTIADATKGRSAQVFVGRSREMRVLLDALEGEQAYVVHVYGVAGIGKSSLLSAFAKAAQDRGAAVIALDGRSLEPTDRGIQTALARSLGLRGSTIALISSRLARSDARTVVMIDHYEQLRLVDTWLRQVLVPALPENVRVVTASREQPVAGWMTSPDLSGAVEVLALSSLERADSLDLLSLFGVTGAPAESLERLTRGHPLALRLAAAAAEERPDLAVEEVATPRVIEELTRLYLAEVKDPVTRQALEAASVVRRMTTSLLAGMLPDVTAADAFERLLGLPFVEVRQDGMVIHEAVQAALSKFLLASDPVRHRQYRRAAWRVLRDEVRDAGPEQLWRYTADMLYLVENPVVREAFFPSGAQPLAVEPATERDLPAIELIAQRHDGDEGRRLMLAWWEQQPNAFSVVRDRDGQVTGFHCLLDQGVLMPPRIADPVVASWWTYLQANPPPPGQRVLGYRRWLDLEHGEMPCASQAASWLDVKRTYMLLRPKLRRMFTVVHDPAPYLPVILKLGFRPLGDEGTVDVDGRSYTSVGLDFGPESVDGWLAGLVADELGLAADVVVDAGARELNLNGRRVQLTPLEFGVLSCLREHEGRTVTRVQLLDAVWGYRSDVGSNVVDVVVRRLRDKLGEGSSALETIRGSGYRLCVR